MTNEIDPDASRDSSCCNDFRVTRRKLLAGFAAGAGGLAASSLIGRAARQVAYAAAIGGNVLVVISLRGGADGLSMIVPHTNADYYRLRPNTAVPSGQLVWRDGTFGLHPSLAPLLPMWRAGTFGAVHAVGLAAPNRSHFEAIEIVEDADLGSGARTGWLNRMIGLDAFEGQVEGVHFGSPLISTALVGDSPAIGLTELSNLQLPVYDDATATREGWRNLWAGSRGEFGDNVRLALQTAKSMRSLAGATVDVSRYPAGPLSAVLANTALLIRSNVGAKVVTVDYGDWDMHSGMGSASNGWMKDHLYHLAQSLRVFFDDLGTTWGTKVTVVTISEFGRRVAENGNGGVDHGYGNCMLLLGGGVRGGRVHGEWPGLSELTEGDLRVRQDYRSVLAEVISRRFPGTNISAVFPGFRPAPIGAMA
jgi:uncharacterized protein (DUF1501 family)